MANIVKIEGLNKENYDTWKIQMRALLVKNDKWCYVSGEVKAPIVTANYATSEAAYKLLEMDVDVNADLLAILLIYSLSQSFENFRCAIESRDELPAPEALRIKIIEENDARKSEVRDVVPNAMIAGRYVRSNHGKRNFNKAAEHKSDDCSKTKCFRCGKFGHIASECRKGGGNSKYSAKGASSNFSLYTTSEIGQNCEATQAQTEANDQQWCLDSGSTSHLCKNLKCFETIDKRRRGKLNLASNASTDISASGNVRVVIEQDDSEKNITIENALHVPDLRTNLLSVGKITDRGYKVVFTKDRARIIDKQGNDKLIAIRKNGLYYMAQKGFAHHAMVTDEDATKSQRKDVLELWHRRLGHLNQRDLLETKRTGIIPSGNIEDFKRTLRCEVCIENKMTRTLFPGKSERATDILEIVHSDVCGPMRKRSHAGNRYCVTFIDDHSRWCEIRFVKSKDQVFDAFRDFKSYIENQTGRKIKFFQSDNGKEYVNVRFDKFLNDKGIRRRLSVAYNPQQNWVAERKNRTIIEAARCLLAQSGLSKSFWAEAVSTANYIRNRCPSRILAGKSPFGRLYGKLPSVKHFREFGCDVYFLNNDPNKGKFEPRSRKGIFVGYSEYSKGYRIWNQTGKRVEIARDVRFLEKYSANPAKLDSDYNSENVPCESIQRDETGSDKREKENMIDVDLSSRNYRSDGIENGGDSGEPSGRASESNADGDSRGDVQSRRGRGRPKKILTGMRGRPRKQYSTVQVGSTVVEEAFMAEIPLERAIAGPDANAWHQAIAIELGSVLNNVTWKIVERQKNANVLRNKYKPSGEIERSKVEEIVLKYISTGNMVADVFTRGLPGPKHKLLSQRLGLDFPMCKESEKRPVSRGSIIHGDDRDV